MAYKLKKSLVAHRANINCLKLDPQGHFLASADEDCRVIIWCIRREAIFQDLRDQGWSQIRCFEWIGQHEIDSRAFAFGCEDGAVHVFQQGAAGRKFHFQYTINVKESVQAMAFDTCAKRLAIGSRFGYIKMYTERDGDGVLEFSWSVRLPMVSGNEATLLEDMAFSHSRGTLEVLGSCNGIRQVCRCGRNSRSDVHESSISLDAETGKTNNELQQGINRIRGRLIFGGRYALAICFAGQYLGLYQYPSLKLVRAFHVIGHLETLQLDRLALINHGKLVIVGSAHGHLYVFDADTERQMQILSHGSQPVQSVTSFSYSSRHLIVTGVQDICIYEQLSSPSATPRGPWHSHTILYAALFLYTVLVLFLVADGPLCPESYVMRSKPQEYILPLMSLMSEGEIDSICLQAGHIQWERSHRIF
ncbi:WD40 repeat-like protein [Sistotremastrum niveocremeum HHB9708]|uniref:WD40 repeat-like protein n=1 Tax=Sistotremastrum niveocremeum HHB9708 TaxID=1314777 RepID=A0A164QDJ7_9AGAM|nr:WD40 repeat-like protein [Sistotremastrum niveocremeum HHB9708]